MLLGFENLTFCETEYRPSPLPVLNLLVVWIIFYGDLCKAPKEHHYDVICYHSVSKVAYFVEHHIGYQPSMFQCSTMSGSNFMEGSGTPPVLQRDKKPSAYRVKILSKGVEPPVLQGDKKPIAYRVKIVPKLFLCAYIKSCFCPVFACLKSVKK